jgi:pyruvate/2-oxoglutarate dehydrogenase complex dihydrolipoamide dehydrogenase (E3) component
MSAAFRPRHCSTPARSTTRRSDPFALHGIGIDTPTIDVSAMLKRKEQIVAQLTGGIGGLFKHNGVTVIQGRGKVLAGANVEVTAPDGAGVSVIEAGSVIIAAGSEPITFRRRRSTTSTSSIPPARWSSRKCPGASA